MKTVDACSSTRLSFPRSHLLQTWKTNGRKIELFYSEKDGLKAKITEGGTVIKVPKIWIRGIPTEIQMRPDIVKACVENTWIALTQSRIGEYNITIHSRLRGGMFQPGNLRTEAATGPTSPHQATANATRVRIDVKEIITKVREASSYAEREAPGKDIILVIGNTGSGKSTFVNYLAGCRMREERVPGKMEMGVVADNPVMEIGHGFNSWTAFPQLHTDPGSHITYCDCPGFLDNRGPSFDIPNAFAIKSIVQHARSIKGIVVLINYHSLQAERGRGLRETINILIQLFGVREEDVMHYRDAIALLISQGQHSNALTLETLREYLHGTGDFPMISQLVDNVGFYDPLDREEVLARGAVPRNEMIRELNETTGIETAGDLFGFALGQDSRLALIEFVSFVENEIRTQFREGNFKKVNRLLEPLQNLQLLNSILITKSFEGVVKTIRELIRGLEGQDESLESLEKIRDEIAYFSSEAKASIDVVQKRLADRQAQEKARAAAEAAQQAAEAEKKEAEEKAAEAEKMLAEAKKATQEAEERAEKERKCAAEAEEKRKLAAQQAAEQVRAARASAANNCSSGGCPRGGGGRCKKGCTVQ